MILEVIGFNIESCIAAEEAGASRIELCDNPAEGGTTPSMGMILQAKKRLTIPIHVMIRPRGGDFLYHADEFELMQRDIIFCKAQGIDGIVTGILNEDGTVDKQRTSLLVTLAYPMTVTFHRAFDRAADKAQALEAVIETGCERILTSGGMPTAAEGIELLKDLVKQAANRIIIMPGSGVRSNNIREIAELTKASEFHSSASAKIQSKMTFTSPALNDPQFYPGVNAEEIKGMLAALNQTTEMQAPNIVVSISDDLDTIYHFYNLAVAYQKTKFDKHWLPFDREMVMREVAEHRQYKIMEGEEVACIFAVTYSDPDIWKERNTDKAVYIHRIVTHPDFRGRNYVKQIISWAREHCTIQHLDYIRMDTWGDNQSLIDYYQSCGFDFLGIITPEVSDDLPAHYSAITLSLFQIAV